MPKFPFRRFALSTCLLTVPFVASGCAVGVFPIVRGALRSLSQSSSGGGAQPFGAGSANPRSLSYRTYAARLQRMPLPTPSQDQIAQVKSAQAEATQWAQQILSGGSKTLNSGPGIVIAEPQLSSAKSSAIDDFGAGCARWLQLSVGGQGALGKTPLWGSVADTRDELGKSDCRWTQAEVPLVAQGTGATHIAIGTLTGTSAHCVLSYQLWDARSNKAVGAPLVVKGTREQILAQLPQMAQMFNARLGFAAESSTRLSAPGVSADDLMFLGSVPWKASDKLLPEQEVRLRALSQKTPLAGLLWMYNGARDGDETTLWRNVAGSLAAQAPSNTLVMATLARRAPGIFAPYAPSLASLRAQFPNNYILLASDWSILNNAGNTAACTKIALKETAASPANPVAWYDLAQSYAHEAQAVRNGKYYGQMTTQEQSRIANFYPNQKMAGLEGTVLDPRSGVSWFQACEGAAFNGEADIADMAYWKAVKLAPEDYDVYWWGLQLYQPKWQPDTMKLHQVAQEISRHPILYSQMMDDIYWAFHEADGSQGQVSSMAADCVAALQAASKRQPHQVAFHRELCAMLKKKSRFPEAAAEYLTWMKLQPDSVIPITNLANLYATSLHDEVNAEKYYRLAAATDPQNAAAATNLGDFYKDTKRDFNQASTAYLQAMKADPQRVQPVTGLANCYWFLKNDEKTGEKYFVQATQMNQNDGAANAEYAWALMRHNKRDQAMVQAQKALTLGYTTHPVFKALGLNTN